MISRLRGQYGMRSRQTPVQATMSLAHLVEQQEAAAGVAVLVAHGANLRAQKCGAQTVSY